MSQLQLVWWFVMVHGFVMFCDVSWWFVMVHVMVRDVSLSWFCHGLSWFVMFYCHGFVMVRHGSRHGSWCFSVMVSSWFTSWFVMFLCHGFVMVRHGSRHGSWCFSVMVSSWFVMFYCHGFVMVHGSRHGSSWFSVMVHIMVRDVSTVMVSSWFVMVCDVLRHGSWCFVMVSSWFVMFYSLKFSRKGSCDPLFSQSEFQIHYQISFLMRLLIFPFPFKEHKSKELC